jgi:hypothetical protein
MDVPKVQHPGTDAPPPAPVANNASAVVPPPAPVATKTASIAPSVPKVIFIIPYRNRAVHKEELLKNMEVLLDGHKGKYAFFFAHQCNTLPFNRGAMKNIGFLAMKHKYPNHYKEIAFIFHDVDSWPREKGLIDYMTLPEPGFVRHFYGYQWCLGGMFSIRGADFENTGGFPNFWGWGLEDNAIHDRCIAAGLVIDRRCFYKISDHRIVRLFDGMERLMSKRELVIYKKESPDGIAHIHNLAWNVKNEFINITSFATGTNPKNLDFEKYDIRKGNKIMLPKGQSRRSWKMGRMFS